MKTYTDVAATALRVFAEDNGVYVQTQGAEAALDAICDALVEAGAYKGALSDFFATEVEEPVWGTPDTDWRIKADADPADVAAALRVLAKALNVTL